MTSATLRSVHMLLTLIFVLCACSSVDAQLQQPQPANVVEDEKAMPVQYLEIVTPDVDATCASLAKVHGVSFEQPDPLLGNARTATLGDGGRLGVRAPMADHEQPIVRPYLRVTDINAAVSAAAEAGGEIAMPATEIPGQGQFAIYILGGIQYGLWQI